MFPAALVLLPLLAGATTPPPADAPTEPARAAAVEPEQEAPGGDDTASRLEHLESEVGELRTKVEDLETENTELREEQELAYEEREALHERVDRTRRSRVSFGGYLDVGMFWVEGNGAGVRHDQGNKIFPQYDGVILDKWVFFGDPLSTAVNARGEPADTGESEAIRFDSIDACGGSARSCDERGKTSFAVNAVNFTTRIGLGDQLVVFAMADVVPRGRDVSSTDGLFLGDFVDLKLAYMLWRPPIRRFDLELYAGKIDSVFGREYRIQESPNRMEVTPSLICRYTCGRPVGVSARAWVFDRAVSLAASVTNGSSYQESFAFYNEVDRNRAKTAAGRIAYEAPVAHLELGVSGQIGAQDLQADDRVLQHQFGFDAHLYLRGFELTAEFLQGRARGKSSPILEDRMNCGVIPCLFVTGAYGTVGYRALNWLLPFFRADWRDAHHRGGTEFVYISRVVRLSPGVRFEITPNFLIKAQYTANLELGRYQDENQDGENPERMRLTRIRIPNDVLTSAIVAHF